MLRSDGFTLLEALVAITIFAFGILAVASMQVKAVQGNAFSNSVTTATCLAQTQLEWLKGQSIGSTDLTVAPINDPNDPSYDENADPVAIPDPNNPINKDGTAGGIYNRSWMVTPGPTATSRRIAVTVTWSTKFGNHTATLASITRGNGE